MATKNGNGNGSGDGSQWTYADWYEKNKKELSDRRRQRYVDDPEYKQKVLDQNRRYRERMAKEQANFPKPRVRIPRHRKPVTLGIPIHGVVVQKNLVHVGSFSRAIGRSVPTIHQWERTGVIPRTPFLLVGANKQERLYTAEMIHVVRAALESRNGQVSSSDGTFYRDVFNGWKGIGVDAESTTEIGSDDGEAASQG